MIVPRQLVLELPHREALGRDDLLVSRSNDAAVRAIDSWPDWPHAGLVLVGSPGSGKTHLVEVWRQRSGAVRLDAAAVSGDPADLIGDAPAIAVEDCGPGLDEAAMFHLLNAAERADLPVLLTSREPPPRWTLGLSDLNSRLSRLPVVEVAPPDEEVLQAVVIKLFADRQIAVDEAVLRYILVRMERSFAAARDIVARLDRLAAESKRPISRSLAARALAEAHTLANLESPGSHE
ncbi:DnaA ATPase domain-containing protein [Microbaculum marinum]|uniref:DnaA/Hda family protein n=1 Tax=Microbaculum marinum TaxID=1764581 RepID=A0AAW9RUD8_9HYPH